jgi:tRNA(fMet)-specific endonuclease VapC
MPSSIRIRRLAPGVSPNRGLLDTSVVIGREEIDARRLPIESAISTLTLAELTCGPLATADSGERARRQELLQRIEANLEALPFDPSCARAMASVAAATAAAGRKIGGARKVDLMIAATALAYGLPLYTLNASDLKGLEGLVEVVDLS